MTIIYSCLYRTLGPVFRHVYYTESLIFNSWLSKTWCQSDALTTDCEYN